MHDLCTLAVIKYLFVCRYLSWALDTNQEERDKVLYTEQNAEGRTINHLRMNCCFTKVSVDQIGING